jgi:hypothetical protein
VRNLILPRKTGEVSAKPTEGAGRPKGRTRNPEKNEASTTQSPTTVMAGGPKPPDLIREVDPAISRNYDAAFRF